MAVDKVRVAAARAVLTILEKNSFISTVVNKFLSEHNWSALDRALFTEIVYGTVRYKLTLDALIAEYSSRKINKLPQVILNIIRTGIYQLVYLDKVPVHAAINESVEITKQKFDQSWANYTNAVLRKISKEKDKFFSCLESQDEMVKFSVKYSYPLWMVKYFQEIFGNETETALNYNNGHYFLSLRANFLKTTPAKIRRDLLGEGITLEYGKYFPESFHITGGPPPMLSGTFRDGKFTIQDEASVMVSWAVNPQPKEVILDLCAAPGGKTTHLAELSADQAEIFAFDTSREKLNLIEENSKRLGLKSIKPEIANAVTLPSRFYSVADKILLDAPCSGLGTINHRPDIKWSKKREDFSRLAENQLEMLVAADRYLKKGGELFYSVCTFTQEETTGVAEKFLSIHKNYKPLDISKRMPSILPLSKKGTSIQTIPHQDGVEGMYLAAFIKAG